LAGFHPRLDSGGDELTLSDERAVDAPDEVATVLVAAGCPPTRLMVHREDLETIFMRTIGGLDDRDG
jgi:ABC-2 type transport system ATP-binding protein